MSASEKIAAASAARPTWGQGDYAAARNRKRQRARERIHVQVLHPIDTPSLLRDPFARPSSTLQSTITMVRLLLAAVVIHGLIIVVFSVVNHLMGERTVYRPPDRVAVQVVELPPPPPEEEEDEEPEEEGPVPLDFQPPEPEPPEPEPPKPKKHKKKAEPPPPAEPQPPEPAAPAPRRRIIGLSMESTVSGGKGPAMATGTSRMGETSRVAEDPNVAAQAPKPDQTETGTGTGRQQRAASSIPTRDAVFVKPKRIKAIKPPYPPTLKAQGMEGDVQVRVTIDATGRVTAVTVLKLGYAAFDEAARESAQREQFEPASRDGKPVSYTLSYSYRFRIEDY